MNPARRRATALADRGAETKAARYVAVAGSDVMKRDGGLSRTSEPAPDGSARRQRLHGAPAIYVLAALLLGWGGWNGPHTLLGLEWLAIGTLAIVAWALSSRHAEALNALPSLSLRLVLTLVPRLVGVLAMAILPWLLLAAGNTGAMLTCELLSGAAGLAIAVVNAKNLPLAASAVVLLLSPAIACEWSESCKQQFGSAVQFSALANSLLASCFLPYFRRIRQQQDRTRQHQTDVIRSLRRERDLALQADREKSRLLAVASHDLRQPVHALGLFAATLERRLQGGVDQPLARNLARGMENLDRSLHSMLDVARLDEGLVPLNIQYFSLRDLFRRLHMHFAGLAEMSNLGLRFSPGGKSVSSDPELLERVLGNLIQNAMRYTTSGGVVVVARTTSDRVNVEIWDTGCGIHAADLPRIFDDFYRADREQGRLGTNGGQGLGLGLPIVKRLARLLGHDLTVVSRPGRGTMFRIGIPIGGMAEVQHATAGADTVPMTFLQERRVLVIDDDDASRNGLCMLLEEWGYEAISADSIEHALTAVGALDAPLDLILSDLNLGQGEDGIDAIRRVRSRCKQSVTAALITGDTSQEETFRATENGLPVLYKPVQPRRLYALLQSLGA